MTTSRIVNGELHAPYFIFVRCTGTYSDMDLLHRFGLSSYRPVKTAQRYERYAILVDAGPWTLIADDWRYTIWHMGSTPRALAQLAESCDVFACSVGESDRSFDFVYYQDSRLVRQFVVEDPYYDGGTVVKNFGQPLAGEAIDLNQYYELKFVLGIAASLGIKTKYTDQDLRVYAPLELSGR